MFTDLTVVMSISLCPASYVKKDITVLSRLAANALFSPLVGIICSLCQAPPHVPKP